MENRQKLCTKCNTFKMVDMFYIDPATKDGFRCHCKECCKLYRKCYRKDNIDKVRASSDRWRSQNKDRIKGFKAKYREKNRERTRLKSRESYAKFIPTINSRFNNWKKNSKAYKRGRDIEWTLSKEYVSSLPLICYYTGEELTLLSNCSNTASLDRIDSSKGYIEGNVCFCSANVNRMKQEFSKEYFIETCQKIARHYEKK